jgi:hypothetical protein
MIKPKITEIAVVTSNNRVYIELFKFNKNTQNIDIEIVITDSKLIYKGGGDIFFCSFYTEDYLVQQGINDKWFPNEGKGVVYCKKITKEFILNHINSIVENIEGKTWKEIAEKLNQYFGWEFENYQGFKEG